MAGVLSGGLLVAPAAAAPARLPGVVHVGQIAREDVPPRAGSEPDTLAEPDIAVSPLDPLVAVAVGHDGRYADRGAVDITSSWTRNGGLTWHHGPVPYLTKAVGGRWDRASDPVVYFGPDGAVYLSAIVLMVTSCQDAVAVLRSTDGGRTWHRPSYAHITRACTNFDDKNWLTVDRQRGSRYYGRVYQFWSAFFFSTQGFEVGSVQAVRWSDDQTRTWSATRYLTPRRGFTQDSQPMILPNGTVVDAYLRSPGAGEGPERAVPGVARRSSAAAPLRTALVARASRDGGATWSRESVISPNTSERPADIRCCLPAATADPVTGRLYAAFRAVRPGGGDAVVVSTSADGRAWSSLRRVDRDASTAVEHINVDVAAYDGKAFVSYGRRDRRVAHGRYVQQEISSSYDGGHTFGPPLVVGPRSDLHYAALSDGFFPGDYSGTAATKGRVYAAWAVSFAPAGTPDVHYHQVLWGAILRP